MTKKPVKVGAYKTGKVGNKNSCPYENTTKEEERILNSEPKTKEEAIYQAITWQTWANKQSLSYGEMAYFQNHFEKTGKKFGLTEEFRENAII